MDSIGKIARRTGAIAARLIAFFLILSVLITAIYRFLPPPITLLMAQRWVEGDGLYKKWQPLNMIAPQLQLAVIAAEDSQFCLHNGFDWAAIKSALKRNERSKRLRGGSTISQQTAKNVFLWPNRDYIRKGIEAYFTFLIELGWPKHRILEVYLNVVEWGDGVFGAEQAAKTYFNKTAKELSRREAALLAALLPNPRNWSIQGAYVRARASSIASRINSLPTPSSCGLSIIQ